jgi:hypothetical protein
MVKEASGKVSETDEQVAGERALLDQLKSLQQHLIDENRQLRELLAARQEAVPPSGSESLEQWEQRRRAQAAKIEAELQAGPSRFEVSHRGDPTRLVGAADRGEAVAKYRSHFGILQSSHEFTVQEAALAAA